MEPRQFEKFFRNETYLSLKNCLYNYRIRKSAVERELAEINSRCILELGCGISPLTKMNDFTVYMDISHEALTNLQSACRGHFVTADAVSLPFGENVFDTVLCSEVVEHLEDDLSAIKESARVLKKGGTLVLTFPHQNFYYGADDRFVGHYRRYNLDDMVAMIRKAGFYPQIIRKILGPMEKMLMLFAVYLFRNGFRRSQGMGKAMGSFGGRIGIRIFDKMNAVLAVFAALDAWIAPRFLSTVILIRAIKM